MSGFYTFYLIFKINVIYERGYQYAKQCTVNATMLSPLYESFRSLDVIRDRSVDKRKSFIVRPVSSIIKPVSFIELKIFIATFVPQKFCVD